MARPRKYPEELLDRGVRLVFESGRPIAHVAKDLGITPEVLRKRVRQAEADNGSRPDLPTAAEREEIRKLRRENYELRRANEILKSASLFLPGSSTRTDRSEPLHRRAPDRFVEPICRSHGVSASAYYERKKGKRSRRAVEDQRLLELIKKTHAEN